MYTYQYFLGDEALITILRVLPFNADLKEKILDIIIDDLVLDFFLYIIHHYMNFSLLIMIGN